jgi:hypothetical protein
MAEPEKAPERRLVTFKQFLEEVHPGMEVEVVDLVVNNNPQGDTAKLPEADMRFYCGHADCGREQNFAMTTASLWVKEKQWTNLYINFRCRNCAASVKTFALRLLIADRKQTTGLGMKIGELPGFGIRMMSPRFSAFLGVSREQYFKGRRAESQGMGIGAFAYYRRVVDAQRGKLFDAIIDVCRTLNVPAPLLAELQAAKKEEQFAKAVAAIKGALPDALYIDGHSPLTLLYGAISKGLHEMSDEECLQKAQAIRVVLTELLARVDRLVTEDKELKAAVAALMPKHSSQKDAGS